MIMYYTCHASFIMEEVEVSRTTKKSVWLLRRSHQVGVDDVEIQKERHSKWADFWDTKEEAAASLRRRAVAAHIKLSRDLERVTECLATLDAGGFPLRRLEAPWQIPATTTLQV